METKESSYTYKYPRPAVTTDCVIFGRDANKEISVLLIERANEPYKGCWAFPGGFLNMDENAETGALRELKEETGLELDGEHLEELGCFSEVDRDPRGRVISIAYYALMQKKAVKGSDDARRAQWFPLSDIPQLAFDHEKILHLALEHLNTEDSLQTSHS